MHRVIRPSIMNSHRQPAQPLVPPKCKIAKARSEVTMDVTERLVQNKLVNESARV